MYNLIAGLVGTGAISMIFGRYAVRFGKSVVFKFYYFWKVNKLAGLQQQKLKILP